MRVVIKFIVAEPRPRRLPSPNPNPAPNEAATMDLLQVVERLRETLADLALADLQKPCPIFRWIVTSTPTPNPAPNAGCPGHAATLNTANLRIRCILGDI